MKVITRILYDLDGVLADMQSASLRLCGITQEQCPKGVAKTYEVVGWSSSDFWSKVDKAFFENLEETPEADALILLGEARVGFRNLGILSSPALNPDNAAGKYAWIKQHYPGLYRQTLIGAPKHFCANEHTLLIDDWEKNCDEFIEAGGNAILVPRYWNKHHALAENVVDHVTQLMGQYAYRIV